MRTTSKFLGPLALAVLLALAACGLRSDDAKLSAARAYIDKHDSAAAVIDLKSVLQTNPESAEARFLLGKVLLDTGDAAGAEAELQRALAAGYPADQVLPPMARALLALDKASLLVQQYGAVELADNQAAAELKTHVAVAQMSLGALDEAITAVENAQKRGPNYVPALVLKARLAAVRGDPVGAQVQADELVARMPADASVWVLKGDLLTAAGGADKTATVDAYRKAILLQPDLAQPHVALLSVLVAQREFDEAAKQWREMKQALPRHPDTLYFEAVLALERKDAARTRELTQLLLRGAPTDARLLLLAGQAEVQLDSMVQAETLLGKAVAAAPGAAEPRLMLAHVLVRTRQADKALATLKPLLEAKVPDPDALALAARAQLLSGDAKAAEASLASAARLKPDDARIRTSLALLHVGKGNADAALRELEAVAAGDARGIGDLALFNARLGRGQFDAALKAADALGAKQPDQPMADYLRGGIALQRGDPAGARKQFEAALVKQPGFVPAVTMLAEMDLAEGKPTARARYEVLIKLDPGNPRVRMMLAELVARTGGSKDEVAKLLGDAVQANPAAPAARIALIDLYLNAGDIKLAFEAATSAAAALPDNVDLLDRLGRVQMAVGEVSQAIVTFNRMKALLPKAAWPHLRLAEAYLAKGDLPAQSAAVHQAMELAPRSLLAQRAGVMVAQQEKNPTKALAIARTVQAQRPDEPMGYAMEGEIQLSEKRYDLAAAAFRKALTKPESSGLAARLHLALVKAQKADEAARFADSWRKDHPDDSAFVLHLGDLAAAGGDLAGAETRYREVLARQPDHVLALNNLAFVLIKGNKPEALPLAERAAKLAPALPQALDTLAMAFAAQGQTDKAVEWQRQAVALAPQSAELRMRLVELYQRVGDKDRAREELENLARLRQGTPNRAAAAPGREPEPASRADSQAASGGWQRLLTVPAWVTGAAPVLVIVLPALLGVGLLVALVVAAFRPAVFRVERSVVVNAPARRVFDLLQDFRQWPHWSVWTAFAPSATRRMAGAAAGARAYCEWSSADKREAGHMEIMEAAAPSALVIEVQRSRPKEETLIFEFVLSSGGDGGTVVRAVASGPAPYGSRVVGVLWSRERRLGKQLKANLAGLKAAAEAAPSAPSGGQDAGSQASA